MTVDGASRVTVPSAIGDIELDVVSDEPRVMIDLIPEDGAKIDLVIPTTEGPPGVRGPTGPEGTPGALGPTGPTGRVGLPGPLGPTGLQGAPGVPGLSGQRGATGPTGATGPAGPSGNPGGFGPTGPSGVGISIVGPTPDTAPSNPAPGQTWIVSTPVPGWVPASTKGPPVPGDGVVWTGASWTNVGPLRGTPGPSGQPGVPGPTGPDGQPTYTWIKYADSDTGTGLSDDPTGKTYIGIAYNKSTYAESDDASDYEWSLFQGPPGADAAIVTLTATSQVLAVPPGGSTTNPVTSTITGEAISTTITDWTYGVDGAAFTTTVPPGVSRTGNVVTITGSVMTAKTISVRAANAAGISDTLTVAKISDGATGGTGDQGPAGADAYTILLTNEAQVFAGTTTAAVAASVASQVIAYKGGTQIPATIGAITGQVAGLTTALTNNATTTAGFTVNVTTALTTINGTLNVPVTADGKSFTKTFSWSLSLTGATGSQGILGPTGPTGQTLYTWLKYADTPSTGMSDFPAGKTYMGLAYNKTSSTESSIYTDYDWSLIQGPQGNTGVQGPTGPNGQPMYTWIKYGDSAAGAGLSDLPAGKTYIGIAYNKTTAAESSVPTDYEWSLIQGPQGVQGPPGPSGPQGVAGPVGPNGQQLYTWVKYADTPSTGMSDLPAGKAYLGLAYNKTSPSESSVYTDYDWTLTTGPTGSAGVPGPAGADGQPTYTWIKYATSVLGAGMSDSPVGKSYMGIAYNKSTTVESTVTTDYEWSLIQGPPGSDAATVTLTATSQVLAVPASGSITTPATATLTGVAVNTTITDWTYGVDGAAYSATVPPGVSRTGNVVTVTGATMTAKTISVRMANAAGVADTLTVAKISDGATGGTGGTGPTGPAGADAYTVLLTNEAQTFAGTTTAAIATSVTSQIVAYKGGVQIPATIGAITGQVSGLTTALTNNGTSTAGFTVTVTTALTTVNGTLTVPLTVDGKSFTKTFVWSLSLAGATGSQGIQGPIGPNGQPTYTWLKYADTPTTGMNDLPAGKVYMGLAYNKASAVESSLYTDYDWSLIQGPQGNQGVQGPTGANGQPTYTWIKYATSVLGAGISDDPTGKTYIGIAYNKTTATESIITTDYEWSLIQGPQGAQGPQGSQGIQGPTGANGVPTYTWVKYADTPTTGMNDLPAGKVYMGIAYNKLTQTESSVYTDYEWSLIQGPQGNTGIQGPAGANGQPTYTWIKYADSVLGAGLNDLPAGKTYMGIAYNKTTPAESSVTTDYEWSLIQGPQGIPGTPATMVDLTATTQVLAVPAAGGATTPATAVITGTPTNTTIPDSTAGWAYSVDGAAWVTTAPPGVVRSVNTVTITGATMAAKTIAVRAITASGAMDTLTVAKVSDGATGSTGGTGATGPAGADAYTVLLSNESQSFAAGLTNALATTATTTVIAYKGTTAQTATVGTITGGATGITAAVTNNGTTAPLITFTVTTALATATGTFTIPVTVGGITFNQVFTWALAFTGATGNTGATGAAASTVDLVATTQALASPAPTILDSFTRADSATSLGTTETGGQAWRNDNSAVWGVSGGKAYLATAGATGGHSYADVECGSSDINISYVISGAGIGGGLSFRRNLTNLNGYLLVANANGTVQFYRVAGPAGAETYTSLVTSTATVVSGDKISVTAAGSTLQAKINDVVVLTTTDATHTGTRHGFYGYGVNSVRWDNFTFASLVTTPATSTITGSATNTTISGWTYSVDGGVFSGTAPAGVSLAGNVATITGATMTARTIAVRATGVSGVTDTMTVAKVLDGATGGTGPTGGTGSTGPAGADAYTILLTNEAQVFPGSTTAALAGSTTSQVIAYKGTVQQSATIGTITGQVTGLSTALTNNGTATAGFTVTVTTALVTTSGTLTVPITVGGITFTKTFAWSVSYTGSQGVQGPIGPNGQQLYTWVKYADTPTTGMSDLPAGKPYLGIAYNKTTATESSIYTDYEWSSTQGPQGNQGVQGPIGPNGQATYTWIKYATSVLGAGINDSPVGMTYMGIAYNKTTPTESVITTDYEWSLIQGPQGVPGANAATITLTSTSQALTSPAAGGATTPATAVVTGTPVNTTITVWDYSVNGAAFSTSLPAGVSIAGNVVTITGSTMTASTIAVRMSNGAGVADTLTVAKVLNGATGGTGGTGPQGPAGADAYTVILTNEAQVFPGTETAAVAGSTTAQVIAYKAATLFPATIGTITGQVTGLTTAITNNATTTATVTVTVTTALVATSGELTIPVTVDGVAFTKKFAWTVSRTGATGSTGGTGAPGVSITAVTPYYAQVTTGSAAPAVPVVATPLAPWAITEPTYLVNMELYTTNKITYSNATFAYTAVAKSSSYAAATAAQSTASSALAAAGTAQSTADGKVRSFFQTSAPTGMLAGDDGDLWFDTDDGNKLYRWTGSAWVVNQDQALAATMQSYVQSRGLNLVTNGTGMLGNNTNFSITTYSKSDAPTGAVGSFQFPAGATQRTMDELIPVDPNQIYEFAYDYRQVSGTAKFYSYLSPYDAYGLAIGPNHYMAQPNTLTTLAVALNPGATTVTLTSAANWSNAVGSSTHLRAFIFWNYVDPGGKAWPANTYSRNHYGYDSYADGAISGNVITLRVPWAGPAIPAGTQVSNASSGGSFMYIGAALADGPTTWTRFSGRTVKGALPGGGPSSATTQFPMATATVQIGFLTNYAPSTGTPMQAVANISLNEITAGADASALASTKIVTFYQTSAPVALSVGDLWVDTGNGNRLSRATAVGASNWVLVQDSASAMSAATAASLQDSQTTNPMFDDWPTAQALPTGYSGASGTVVKETTLTRTNPYAVRWNLTAGGSGYFASTGSWSGLPNLDYVTVTIDFMLVSGDLTGAGHLVRWVNTVAAYGEANILLATAVPSPALNKWYRVTRTIKRPATFTGTFSYMEGYVMGGYGGFGTVTAKNIIFDQFSARAATDQEIQAYNAASQGTVDTLQTQVNGKITTFYSATAPTATAIGDLWVDTANGNRLSRASASGTGGWVGVQDSAIAAAQSTANAAILMDNWSNNPLFDNWPAAAALPNGYVAYGGSGVRETTTTLTAPNAIRFNVTAGGQSGVYGASGSTGTGLMGEQSNTDYVMCTMDFCLVSGTIAGAGLLLDWLGLTPNRTTLNLAVAVPAPTLGKWYRVSQVMRRPVGATGTFTNYVTYLMGNYSGIGDGTKNIVFDQLSFRAATDQEIQAYNAAPQSTVTTLQTQVNTKVSTFYAAFAATPTATAVGDLWVVTDQSNRLRRASALGTGSWVDVVLGDDAVRVTVGGTNLFTKSRTFQDSNVRYAWMGAGQTTSTVSSVPGPYNTPGTSTPINETVIRLYAPAATNRIYRAFEVKQIGWHTVSFWYKSATGTNYGFAVDINDQDVTAFTATSAWQKGYVRSRVTSVNATYCFVDFDLTGAAGDIYIFQPQLELGQNATFYSPSPEEVAADTAAAQAKADAGYTAATLDALAPASSPTPVVTGSISSLGIKWPAILNHDTVTYEVHCSTAGATFTPDSTTKQIETTSSSYTIREQLANGDFLVKDNSFIYYVRIIAKDGKIGGGFNLAAPGTAGSAVLRQVVDADINDGYIYTNVVDALQITGAKIDADLAILGKLKTAESGQRMELSSDGLKQYGPDGVSVRVDLPNDPQKTPLIDAVLIARGLTVSQGMEVRGQSTFAMGSKTILQTQTVGATSGPSLGTDYPSSTFARGQWCDPFYGLHLDSAESSGSFRTANTFFDNGVLRKADTIWRPPRVTNSDGATNSQYTFEQSTAIVVGGLERQVTRALFRDPGYVAARDEKMMLTSWDDSAMLTDGTRAPIKKAERQDGTFSWFWQWPIGRCFSATGATRAHMVCQAKRNMWLAWPQGDITLSTLAFTDTTITPSANKVIASSFFAQDETLIGVTYGSSQRMGFEAVDRDIWVLHGTVNNYVFNDAASPVRLPDLEFPAVPATRSVGACGDLATGAFTRFTVAPATDGPQLYNYTPITWASTDSPIWWGTFTWYDSAGTIQESNASVYSSITMKKRSRLTVTVPGLPDPAAGRGTTRTVDDVNSFRFFLTRMATTPVRTDFIRQNQQPADLATVLSVDTPIFTGGSGPPPLNTSFVAQAPASIESNAIGTGSLPKIKLTGDGYAHLEALDVGGSGATSLSGKAFEQLYYSIRSQSQIIGGGAQIMDTGYNIKWTARFVLISMGRGLNFTTDGNFDITMPPLGTAIANFGGALPRSVVAAGIHMDNWDALWYEIPYGGPVTSIPANFRVTNYTSDFSVPNNWILVAVKNGDSGAVRFVTGNIVVAGSAGGEESRSTLVNPATGWSVSSQAWRRAGRQVSGNLNFVRTGAAVAGSSVNGNTTDTLCGTMSDTTWAPILNTPFPAVSAAGLCQIYCNTNGSFYLTSAMGGVAQNANLGCGSTYST
jgi:hypothetical protein